MDKYILFKGLKEDTLVETFAGIVLGSCSKFIYYDHPDYKKLHDYYWEDDECKVVFFPDILEKIINLAAESERQYIRKILTQVTKFKNIKILDFTKFDYQTIIALAKSYVVDYYGVVYDMAGNKVNNINIPVSRYPLGNHAGLLTREPLSKVNIRDLSTMIRKDNKKYLKLNEIKTENLENITLTLIGVTA